MKITKAEFISSSPNVGMCPKDSIPEYAFIGRSNVGKSSLINTLVNRRRLGDLFGRDGAVEPGNLFFQHGLDGLQRLVVLRRHQHGGEALASRPSRASDAVDVGVGRIREVEVDDVRDLLDVDAARRDVGRDEALEFALLEARQRALARIFQVVMYQ